MRHHTPKTMTPGGRGDRDLLWRNFVFSVWTLIAWCAYQAITYLSAPHRLQDAYGPFSMRVLMWPFGIAGMELLLWFFVFRERGTGTRLFAAFMGLALLLRGVLVGLLTATVYELRLDPVRMAIYSYVAVSHLAFAILGREER